MSPSQRHLVTVRCSRCQRSFRAPLGLLALDAEAFAVLGGGDEATHVACPHCQARNRIELPLLYRDAQRQLALACVPAAAVEPQQVVNALLNWDLQHHPEEAHDYALHPTLVTSRAELLALTGGDSPVWQEYDVEDVLEWLRALGEGEVLQTLEALGEVVDEESFLAALNGHPALLDPNHVDDIQALGERAEDEGQRHIADVLRDLAAALRMHTPAEVREDEEFDDSVPEEVRDLLLAGDVETAAAFLDDPDDKRQGDLDRILRGGLPELMAEREGYLDHARLFGHMVEDMMAETVPLDAPAEAAYEIPETAFAELLEAPSLGVAVEVVERWPELANKRIADTLRRLMGDAADSGDEGRRNQLDMLLQALYVYDDTLWEDDDESGDEDAA